MAPILLAGLSLLPKIPKMWDAVAGLFGKKAPSGVMEAGELASGIMKDLKKDQISPEVQLKLEELCKEHEREMAKHALEEKKLKLDETKLEYKDAAGVRELEIAAYNVDDPLVRQTRPKILRKLFVGCIAYAFYAPLSVIAIAAWSAAFPLTITTSTVALVVSMVKWIGGWLFGTFSASYLGYATARSVDKRNPIYKEGNGLLNKGVKKIMEIM